ncbi:cation:dicarboxylase symporter family transporter [Phenylobacterium sp.]|uniref:dicarboxylate/amino acid:cation symporter n=1 Tax=Phenylobacterium sp. TaxID=1871053 RepID=UPI00198799CA|nr:cation:dicarboxylase symporter family transporter [Phenylobacterium sp.]MBC7166660.1 cation:dicarboxylase symporter family transporter [Phenylobacterium sp.]
MIKSLSLFVLGALVAGLVTGSALFAYGGPAALRAAEVVEALGALWLNALRMTIVPLVFSLLVTGVASAADAAATGRLAARAFALFAIMLVIGALFGLFAMSGLIALWPVDPQGAAAMTAAVEGQSTVQVPPGFAAWLPTLAPSNPIRAAAEDAILQIVVFGLIFGFALTRLPQAQRGLLTQVFRALAETMIVIVRWVLLAAPVGVFALALGIGLRAGLGAAGVLAQYVVMVTSVTAAIALLPYGLILLTRRSRLADFIRATAPVQALAFSTQSSLACLPVMLEKAQDDLRVPPRVAGVVLPLAVAIFRLSSPVANLAVAVFVAHLYGLSPSFAQFAAAVAVAFVISIGTVGLPGQASFFASIAPICVALGVPVEILAVLLAVEVIPDIFRTVGNVTADMAVTVVLEDEAPEPATALG